MRVDTLERGGNKVDLNKHPNTNVGYIIQKHEDDLEAYKKRTATLEKIAIESLFLAVYFLVKKSLKK